MNTDAMSRARLALDGLSVGDSFGEKFFVNPATVEQLIAQRAFPAGPWRWTDDTAMGLAIVDMLERFGEIDQSRLAVALADGYRRDIMRGYGGTAHQILQLIGQGIDWQTAAGNAFGGQGSMGNGAAMRAAPVGAYFANDYAAVVDNAIRSAQPTHAHPDGQAGAVAVAVAAAYAARISMHKEHVSGEAMLQAVIDRTPVGATLEGLVKARSLPLHYDLRTAVSALGNGSQVISSDTVPFAIWCAARHLTNFEEAMWTTVAGLGDRDTTCAIVGGIVALAVGRDGIPLHFMNEREPLLWPIPLGEQYIITR
jgi:ADP-ribosylglycohydrolase